MSAVELCSKQSSKSRGTKRERVVWNYVRGTNSTSEGDDDQFTTITTTFVTTVVVPVPTKTTTTTTFTLDSAFCTSTSRIQLILPSSSRSTTSIQPSPSPSSSLPSTTEPQVSSRQSSSFIIGIILAVIVFIFILVSYLAWHKRKRRSPATPPVGDRPSLLPKFSFERANEGPPKTSGTFVDKFTRLDKTHSPGVRWVADNHGTTNQTPQAKAARRSMLLFTQSFDHMNQESRTKASRGSMLLFAQSLGPSLTKATVVSTFITGLSDELPVAVGQRLNVLAEYDDGWTFCVNERGEQGMVPVECLHREKKA